MWRVAGSIPHLHYSLSLCSFAWPKMVEKGYETCRVKDIRSMQENMQGLSWYVIVHGSSRFFFESSLLSIGAKTPYVRRKHVNRCES